jgi:D-sedoheptulose 7-phosphate isomerase
VVDDEVLTINPDNRAAIQLRTYWKTSPCIFIDLPRRQRCINTMTTSLDRLRQGIQASIDTKQRLLQDEALLARVEGVIDAIEAALRRGNRVIFAGNGGSAADAQHLAAEFVSRFEFDRPGLPSLSLATDTSMLTAIGNDYGYEKLFLRQLQAQARAGDVFVGITTSGKSPNVLAAFAACPALGVTSVALCGTGGALEGVDHVLRAPSGHTPRIQESHILIGHMICAEIELRLFAELAPKK